MILQISNQSRYHNNDLRRHEISHLLHRKFCNKSDVIALNFHSILALCTKTPPSRAPSTLSSQFIDLLCYFEDSNKPALEH